MVVNNLVAYVKSTKLGEKIVRLGYRLYVEAVFPISVYVNSEVEPYLF